MDELTIGDKIYISSKRAAKITGYAKDYVGQLCREGRVEARLVGRNWYVLEGAIREHRFGAPEEKKEEEVQPPVAKKSEISVDSTWSMPSYRPEVPAMMPKLTPVEPAPSPIGHDEQVVADMQAAWKDWFKSDQKSLPDGEDMLESAAQEEVPLATHASATPVTEEDVAVRISRLENASHEPTEPLYEQDIEEVVLHRNYTDQEHGEVIPTDHDIVDLSHRTDRARVVNEQEEGVIMSEKRHKVRKSGSTFGSSIVLRAFFYAVALLAILVGLIGSGYADTALRGLAGYGVGKNVIIQYLEGTRTFEK